MDGPYGTLLCVILYGRGGFDRDYVFIYDNLFLRTGLTLGKADILFTDLPMMTQLLRFFDPVGVEPVLSGESVYQKEADVLSELRSLAKKLLPDVAVLHHLEQSSNRCLSISQELASKRPADHRLIAVEAMHALSYWFLAKTYARQPTAPLTVTDALPLQAPSVQALWSAGLSIKKNGGDVSGYVRDVASRIDT